jgi:3-phosphoshikimate 1-carboxyvinyltransferase
MSLRRAKRLYGTIRVPGDKSISHRAAILAAMCEGTTRITNFSSAGDCQTTLNCLERLGVRVSRDATDVVIEGVGKTGFCPADESLDCGNSGTTARLLAGILAGQEFDSVITGDASLRSRPMKRII